MKFKTLRFIVVAGGACLLSACGQAGPPILEASADGTVVFQGQTFAISEVSIPAGTDSLELRLDPETKFERVDHLLTTLAAGGVRAVEVSITSGGRIGWIDLIPEPELEIATYMYNVYHLTVDTSGSVQAALGESEFLEEVGGDVREKVENRVGENADLVLGIGVVPEATVKQLEVVLADLRWEGAPRVIINAPVPGSVRAVVGWRKPNSAMSILLYEPWKSYSVGKPANQ